MKYYKCPFCNGSKVKPYVRNGYSQDCKDCNKDGMISEKVVKKYDLQDFIDTKTCVEIP